MMPPIEDLLPQEAVIFEPKTGVFDTSAVDAALSKFGFSFRDEADPSRFALCSTPEGRDTFEAKWRADPDHAFPLVPLVDVQPERVRFSPINFDEQHRDLSRKVMEWLMSHYDCHISNDRGADLRAD